MPSLTVKPNYHLVLDHQEMRLVLRALSGIIEPDTKDSDTAKALSERLQEQQVKGFDHYVEITSANLDATRQSTKESSGQSEEVSGNH